MSNQTFASVVSAKKFVAHADLGKAFSNPFVGLFQHPDASLLAAAGSPRFRAAVASTLSTFSTTAADTGATQPAAQAVSPAPTDPASLQQALNIKNQLEQGFIVGNGVISFDNTVTDDRKEAAIYSLLFAQLVANKAYPKRETDADAIKWFSTYFNTLTNIGWIIQGDSQVHSFQGTSDGTVEQELLTLASSLVGASGAQAVKAIFDAIASLGKDNPIITFYKAQTETLNTALFSVSLGSQSTAGFLIEGIQFDLTASADDHMILFVEWKSTEVRYNWRNLKLSVADDVFNEIKDDIRKKITPFAIAFVQEVDLGPPPPPPGN